MDDSKQQIVNLELPGKWNGKAVEKWSGLIYKPAELTQKPDLVFKSDNGNITALKQVEFKGEKFFFVVKKTARRSGIKAIVDLLRMPKSLKNLKLALLLKQKNIETAQPAAALWHAKLGCIYITEYIKDSLNLYDIAFGKNKEILNNFSARKAVIRQVAEIIAKLHKSGFWHRDPKAGNFIVYKENDVYKVKLVDLDGIKHNLIDSQEKQIRTLANLAKTLIRFKMVNLADLYRGFEIYYRAMEIERKAAKKLFYKVERATVAMRLLNVLEESRKFKEE